MTFGHHHMELLLGHEFYRYNYESLWGSKLGMASYFTNQTLAGAIKMDNTGESGNSEYESEASSSVGNTITIRSILEVFLSVVTLPVALILIIVGVTSTPSVVLGLLRKSRS